MVNKPIRCDKCRELITPTFFGKNKLKVWTKYTLEPTKTLSMGVCRACYVEAYPQKDDPDFPLPSPASR